jgi:Na+-transporting NADH:ubiquinone oxidoreductase subunit F
MDRMKQTQERWIMPKGYVNLYGIQLWDNVVDHYNETWKEMEMTVGDCPNVFYYRRNEDFKAGQYVQLMTPKYAKQKQSVSRAYSISSKPSLKNQFQLIIRRVPEGICTTWVHDHLKVGDKVNLTGPYGDFFIRDTKADIIYVAGGSGKAPIKSMLEDLKEKGTDRRMAYFFGAVTKKDLYLTDYMEEFKQVFDDFDYYPVLSNPTDEEKWEGRKGFVMPFFSEYIKDPKNTEAYLCGSPRMLDSVCKELVKMGVPEDNIYFDSFA